MKYFPSSIRNLETSALSLMPVRSKYHIWYNNQIMEAYLALWSTYKYGVKTSENSAVFEL